MSTNFMDVTMPDGTIVHDVPVGTTQAEVLRRYNLRQASAGASPDVLQQQAVKFPTAAERGAPAGSITEPANVFAPDRNTPWNIVKGLGRTATNIAMMPGAAIAAAGNPLSLAIPIQEQFAKAFLAPTASEKVGHTLGAMIPGIGPWAAGVGERIGGGDIAGGITEAASMMAAPHIVAKTPGAIRAIANKVTTPEALQMRAAANRQPVNLLSPGNIISDVAAPLIGYATGGTPAANILEAANLFRQSPFYRGPKAALQTKFAEFMAKNAKTPAFATAEPIPGAAYPDIPPPLPVIQAVGRSPVEAIGQGRIAGEKGGVIQTRPREYIPGFAEPQRAAEFYSPPPLNIRPPGRNLLTADLLQQLNEKRALAERSNPVTLRQAVEAQQEAEQLAARAEASQPTPAGPGVSAENQQFLEYLRTTKPLPAKFASTDVNQWIGVNPKELKYGGNPGPQLIQEHLIATEAEAAAHADPGLTLNGNRLKLSKQNTEAALKSAGSEMQAKLEEADRSGIQLNIDEAVRSPLKGAQSKLGAPTDKTFKASIDSTLQKIITRYGDLRTVTPSRTHALKVELGDAIDWTTAEEKPVNESLKQIYRNLNTAIKDQVPGIGPVQQRWGNLYIGRSSLKDAVARDMAGKKTGSAPVEIPGGRIPHGNIPPHTLFDIRFKRNP